MVYKTLNGLAPDYVRSMFTDRGSVTSYSLRDTEGKLAIPKPRTNYRKDKHWKTSFEKKLFFCVGEYAEYWFDQQRLIWYRLWDMVFS